MRSTGVTLAAGVYILVLPASNSYDPSPKQTFDGLSVRSAHVECPPSVRRHWRRSLPSFSPVIPSIEANCRYRQWFAVSSEEDRNRLVKGSGETIELAESRTYTNGPNGSSNSVTYQEQTVPRLRPNDILLASAHPRQSIVRISRGDGYAVFGGMPVIVESNYHISKEEFEQRKNAPWPDAGNGAFLPKRNAGDRQPAAPSSRPPGAAITTEIIGGGQLPPEFQANPFETPASSQASSEVPRSKRRKESK